MDTGFLFRVVRLNDCGLGHIVFICASCHDVNRRDVGKCPYLQTKMGGITACWKMRSVAEVQGTATFCPSNKFCYKASDERQTAHEFSFGSLFKTYVMLFLCHIHMAGFCVSQMQMCLSTVPLMWMWPYY
jgi:hypothetical protein